MGADRRTIAARAHRASNPGRRIVGMMEKHDGEPI